VNVPDDVVPSVLRDFSAPVILDDGLSDADRLVLLAHDTDPVNRWEAGQRLALSQLVAAITGDGTLALNDAFVDAMRSVLRDPSLDPAFKELVLTPPSEAYVSEQLTVPVDPQRVHAVCLDISDSGCRASWPGRTPLVGDAVDVAWEVGDWQAEDEPGWVSARVARIVALPFGARQVGFTFEIADSNQAARVRAWHQAWLHEHRQRLIDQRAA